MKKKKSISNVRTQSHRTIQYVELLCWINAAMLSVHLKQKELYSACFQKKGGYRSWFCKDTVPEIEDGGKKNSNRKGQERISLPFCNPD